MAAAIPEEVSCRTCFMPSQDLPCATGKASQNLFASVGFSDARLGMKHAEWRATAASARVRSEGESTSASNPSADAPATIASDLKRLLHDDLDDFPDEPAAFAPVMSNIPADSNKYPDILPFFDASRDDTDTDMCTTCWNVGSAMDERRQRTDYQLPATAMALGSSKVMSEAERDFVQSLISGAQASVPEPEFSEEAAEAAKLAGMTILPKANPRVADDDLSSVTSSEADLTESQPSSGDDSARSAAFVFEQGAAACSAEADTDTPTHRAGKRLADCMDASDDSVSAERSAMSTAVAAQARPSSTASKRPKRAAASRATERARQALLESGETSEYAGQTHASVTNPSPRGYGSPALTATTEGTWASSACMPAVLYATGSSSAAAACSSSSVSSSSSAAGAGATASRSRSRSSSAKGRQLPEWSVHVLKEWLLSPEHFDYPWPTSEEKADLASRAGVDERQLGIWLTNARKRLWMPLRKRQGLPIPRYSDAKSERMQRALVERVHHEAVKAGKDASVPAAAILDTPRDPAAASASRGCQQTAVVPPPVDAVGVARVVAALRAEEAQLQADEAALQAQKQIVATRAANLESVPVAQEPSFLQAAQPQCELMDVPALTSASSSSSSSLAAAAACDDERMHCFSSFYMPPMLSSASVPSDPMQPSWDGSDLAADDSNVFGAFDIL